MPATVLDTPHVTFTLPNNCTQQVLKHPFYRWGDQDSAVLPARSPSLGKRDSPDWSSGSWELLPVLQACGPGKLTAEDCASVSWSVRERLEVELLGGASALPHAEGLARHELVFYSFGPGGMASPGQRAEWMEGSAGREREEKEAGSPSHVLHRSRGGGLLPADPGALPASRRRRLSPQISFATAAAFP